MRISDVPEATISQPDSPGRIESQPEFLSFEVGDYALHTKGIEVDYHAPDGLEIGRMAGAKEASFCRCAIRPITKSRIMCPETEEVWYGLSGHCTFQQNVQE